MLVLFECVYLICLFTHVLLERVPGCFCFKKQYMCLCVFGILLESMRVFCVLEITMLLYV